MHCRLEMNGTINKIWFLNFQQKGVDSELTRRSLTHSAWDLSSSKSNERRGWHPMTYKFSDATPDLIQSIKVHIDLITHGLISYGRT